MADAQQTAYRIAELANRECAEMSPTMTPEELEAHCLTVIGLYGQAVKALREDTGSCEYAQSLKTGGGSSKTYSGYLTPPDRMKSRPRVARLGLRQRQMPTC